MENYKPKAEMIILMGLPLAGKSSWIKDNIQYYKGYDIISADAIKEAHPNYDPNNTEKLHEYSVMQAKKKLYAGLELEKNMIFDSGSINNSYTKNIISEIRKYNYKIKLIHVKTPYQICLKRNESRERKVPAQAIIQKAVVENAQFHKLAKLVDYVTIVPYFTDKHIFVDMDGIIAALSTLPKINGEIDFVNGEVHRYLKPVLPVINKLNMLQSQGKQLYILSAAPNSFSIEEKNEWLNTHFPIPKEHRFFVNQGRYKSEMLDNLSIKLKLDKQDVMLLDDFHATLYEVLDRGMHCMHISEFLSHEF